MRIRQPQPSVSDLFFTCYACSLPSGFRLIAILFLNNEYLVLKSLSVNAVHTNLQPPTPSQHHLIKNVRQTLMFKHLQSKFSIQVLLTREL